MKVHFQSYGLNKLFWWE